MAKPRSSALRTYRRRVKSSSCRKLRARTCNRTPGCKYTTKGTKRNFCRKGKNSSRRTKRA